MAKGKREEIKADLVSQLEMGGNATEYYLDLVEDYMSLWATKNLLIADIRERGVVVETVSANGTKNQKKNDSVGDLVKLNAQMLKLLDSLGIKPGTIDGGDLCDL